MVVTGVIEPHTHTHIRYDMVSVVGGPTYRASGLNAGARARATLHRLARLPPLPRTLCTKSIRIYSACLVRTAFVSCPGSIFIVARGGAVNRERRWWRPTEREEREDWPNGIGEPDRRRLADTALYSGLERCPLAYRTVVLAVFFSLGVVDCVLLLFHLPPPRSRSQSRRRCRPASRKTSTAASVLRKKKNNRAHDDDPLTITTYRVIFYY